MCVYMYFVGLDRDGSSGEENTGNTAAVGALKVTARVDGAVG